MTLIESLHALEQKWREQLGQEGVWPGVFKVLSKYPDELLAVLRQMDNPWNDPILGGSRMEREQPSNGETEVTK